MFSKLTNMHKYSNYFGKDCIFALQKGGLAHLARARHWQCRGDRFESGNLHKRKSGLKEALKPILVLFLWPIFKLLV